MPIASRALPFALLLLAGCAGTPPTSPTSPTLSVAGLWRVDQAMTEPLIDRSQARLDFRPDGTLVGHTSCNSLSASYTLQGDRLAVGPVVTTRRACGPMAMEQEDRILTALEAARTARVRPDGLLELRNAEGRGMLRGTRFMEGGS
ncbi:META domain-containing protein [Aquincola tertiaricarbonis]|uniref:META domain-containing protein n=1 Tax=Aquincola tertiaricarbonis TaxID=391953 RepID=A0ABY4RZW8_AQUTE|nr:META domain-containing protein [Aquincola tertiaricarbonis]URI06541.1 META domain-containing protein [Aquincola tertiaricarbonis]